MTMIDKVAIQIPNGYYRGLALMVGTVWNCDGLELEVFTSFSRNESNVTLIRPRGMPGVVFRCHKENEAPELMAYKVKSIEFNPSAFSHWGEFLTVVVQRLDPTFFEQGAIVTRVDYAIDLPWLMDDVVRGLYWENRRRHEDYNLFTPTTTREYVVGSRPHSVAVYDRARKLCKMGFELPEGPLTRIERRVMRHSEVHEDIRVLYDLRQLFDHALRIRRGEFNPFEGIHVYRLTMPPIPEVCTVYRDYMARHIAIEERWGRAQSDVGRYYEVSGMMRVAMYPVLRNIMLEEYPDIWEQVAHTEPDLQQLFIDGLSPFFPRRIRRHHTLEGNVQRTPISWVA